MTDAVLIALLTNLPPEIAAADTAHDAAVAAEKAAEQHRRNCGNHCHSLRNLYKELANFAYARGLEAHIKPV